jgi:hypothetical protein
MKKVLMGHEEQNTINNQSNELLTIDPDNSINTQNEILVRKFFFVVNISYSKILHLGRSNIR